MDSDEEEEMLAKAGRSTGTPDGSRWGAGSEAGRSVNLSRSGASPVKVPGDNKSPGATGMRATGTFSSGFSLMPDSLGVDKWNDMLKPLRDTRNMLEDKIKTSKKKRRKKGKKSNLKGGSKFDSESNVDDAVSAFTG